MQKYKYRNKYHYFHPSLDSLNHHVGSFERLFKKGEISKIRERNMNMSINCTYPKRWLASLVTSLSGSHCQLDISHFKHYAWFAVCHISHGPAIMISTLLYSVFKVTTVMWILNPTETFVSANYGPLTSSLCLIFTEFNIVIHSIIHI